MFIDAWVYLLGDWIINKKKRNETMTINLKKALYTLVYVYIHNIKHINSKEKHIKKSILDKKKYKMLSVL